MAQQPTLSIVQQTGDELRDRYRWLLLTGWFVLISTVFFIVAMPPRAGSSSAILLALAALALTVYNVAIKRYWTIALGLLIGLIAVMGWIVAR